MSYDKNISPEGWYIASYLIRFIELNEEGNDDPERRFLAWENTIIVQANNWEEAYDKVVEEAMIGTGPYKGGTEGVPVQWVYEGITELLPIYEKFEHGAELMYREHNKTKLKNLRKKVKSKNDLKS